MQYGVRPMVRSFAILPVAALALAVSACGGAEDTKPSRPVTTTTSTTSSSASSGGGGGSGGGSTGEGGQGGAGQGGAGQGGAGQGGAGGVPPLEVLPADEPCLKNIAYQASGMSFAFPTPVAFASVLNSLTYDPGTHPIGVVLLGEKGAESASVGISAMVEGAGAETVFVHGKDVPFMQAQLRHGGFETASPASKGWLRIKDDSSAPVDIELESISLRVTTRQECSQVLAVLDASIAESALGLVIEHGGQSATIGDLLVDDGAGGEGGRSTAPGSRQVHAVFAGESTNFDFGSL